ncbi:MAG: hypothetical protein R3Y68_08065 [Rikenellaceae bacterium]
MQLFFFRTLLPARRKRRPRNTLDNTLKRKRATNQMVSRSL